VVIKNLIWENKDDITDELETVKVFLDKGIDMDGTFTPFIVPEIPVESQEPNSLLAVNGRSTNYLRPEKSCSEKRGSNKHSSQKSRLKLVLA